MHIHNFGWNKNNSVRFFTISIYGSTTKEIALKKIFAVVFSVVVLSGFSNHQAATDGISYPEGFRKWTHIKSNFLDSTHPNVKYRGFNHVYANDKGMQGYETGIFPDGAIIVFDVIEAVHKNNHSEEAKRNHIDVMVKDSTKFFSTGGWNFGQFEADKTPRVLTKEMKTKCADCHASQKDYVFSEFRP